MSKEGFISVVVCFFILFCFKWERIETYLYSKERRPTEKGRGGRDRKGGELMQSIFKPGSDMMGTEFWVGGSGCIQRSARRKDQRWEHYSCCRNQPEVITLKGVVAVALGIERKIQLKKHFKAGDSC